MKKELYPGIAFSPQATLAENIGAADTIIKVSDTSAFPEAPNLATIGIDEDGETILYTAKTAEALSGCQRGIEGTAKAWKAGEIIGRNFTAKDHNDMIENLAELAAAVSGTGDMAASTYDPQGKQTDIFQFVEDSLAGIDVSAFGDLVTLPGGGSINVPESFGGGPYTFEVTPDEEDTVSASQVSYDGTESGARADNVQSALDFLYSISIPSLPPEMHRMIFRGKNLGTALTAAQKTVIQNGTFDDLWLGDYWVIGGVNWRIVDFDYWWNCGDTAFTKHHLVIMPDANLGDNKQMNTTNTTEGGYVGSLMKTSNMNDAKAKCTAAFGANILYHMEYLTTAVANGKPSAGAWLDSTIELPNECMIYGHHNFAPACDGTTVHANYTIDKTQLALFAVDPKFITTRRNYWLQDVVTAAIFAGVTSDGGTYYDGASGYIFGVRPVFPVGVS